MVSASQDSEPPKSFANVTPVDLAGAGQTRMIVDAVKESVAELRSDVKEIRGHRFPDFVWHITVFAAGFLLLCGVMAAAYFRIDDRLRDLSLAATRVDTKLEDLLQRIPPMPAPIPKK